MVSSRTATLILMMAIMCGGSVEAESWKKHQIYRKTRLCNGLDPADFNRDGFMDYVTNFEDTGTIVIVFHPNLQGVRNGWPNVIAGQFDRAESSCAGDMDGDGWCDIAVAHGHEGVGEKAGITVIWNPAQKYKSAESTAWKNSEFIPGSIELGNYLFVRSADINADGLVDAIDFSIIQMNFLMASKNTCCPDEAQPVPFTEISVKQLRMMGLGDLVVADLNGDGLLNVDDMEAYQQGVTPVDTVIQRKRGTR